ncbi:MAG TPA: sulfite oxidase [Burkholderiaceae bacterium]|nr:sulfite oxidase [Burkholderiaceae bacterium]
MSTATNLVRRRLLARGAGALAAAGLGGACAQTTPAAQPAAAPAPAAAPPAAAAPAATPAAASGAKPLPPYVAWKDANAMIVHTATTIETKRTAFGSSLITPADRLYIRNNLPAPDVSIVADRDGWPIVIEGVRQPRTLKVAELKSLGLETTAMVLQCSGNGRSYFPTKPSGTKWTVGAAGCLLWSGVPVRAVVQALGGLADGVRFMTGTGGEKLPDGVDPKTVMVERSVPLKAMEDALLAWEMNGEPVPHAHGGPLRLIVPGYSGVNNVKYIKRLVFTQTETDAAIQKTGYRMSPPGQKGDPSQPSVWEMDVKSWINSPAPEAGPVRAGLVQIHGVAMGGMNAAARVEVSTDGGKTWKDARLIGPDLGRYAWRQFVLPVQLAPGTYVLASRAADAKGNVQVEATPDNGGGYLNSGWRVHALQITVV